MYTEQVCEINRTYCNSLPINFIPFLYAMLSMQMAEYRVSIYGRKQSEWDQLASWIVNNDLYSENVVWLIQVFNSKR